MPNHRNLPIRSLPMFTQFLSRKWHLRALMVRFNSKSQCWAGSMILGLGKRAMQFLGEDEKRGAGSSGCNSWKCRRGLNHRGYEKEAGWCLAWVGKYNFFWGDIQRWLIPSSITIYHQIFLSITIHHSVGRAGWKWVGRMNSNWWAVKKTTMVPSLTHVDISHVCKCRWLELENKQIVLGEIQRCSKRSVDITCLQMRTAGFDKCTTAKPANPYIVSAQIHANHWGPLLLRAYAGTFCHQDNHSHWKRWLIIIILMIKLCQIY